MAIQVVLGHAAEHPVDGILLALDQEKVYNQISHPFLFAVLNAFGFSSLLQHAFASTFLNTLIYLVDNDHLVGPIAVGVGVVQGNPLAPFLFDFAFESVLITLHSWLTGVRLPWGAFLQAVFADDTHLDVGPLDETPLLKTLEAYSNASNNAINFKSCSTFLSWCLRLLLFGSPVLVSILWFSSGCWAMILCSPWLVSMRTRMSCIPVSNGPLRKSFLVKFLFRVALFWSPPSCLVVFSTSVVYHYLPNCRSVTLPSLYG